VVLASIGLHRIHRIAEEAVCLDLQLNLPIACGGNMKLGFASVF